MKVAYDMRKAIQKEMRLNLYIERIRCFSFRDKLRLIFNIFKKG
jgi:hypothetical protein